jgi:hypothetical protein
MPTRLRSDALERLGAWAGAALGAVGFPVVCYASFLAATEAARFFVSGSCAVPPGGDLDGVTNAGLLITLFLGPATHFRLGLLIRRRAPRFGFAYLISSGILIAILVAVFFLTLLVA